MKVEDSNGIRTITFDRPDSLNAFTAEAATDLAAGLSDVSVDNFDAVVLTGEGKAFSAGGDIQAMAERKETADESFDRVTRTLGRVVETVLTTPVPIIAKVNGDAVGAGLSITAVSDFAYAIDSASFSCAFVRVGLIPDTGGTFLLPKLIGLRAAKRLAFTGEFISAEEAADLGLINGVVNGQRELNATVDNLISILKKQPSKTIALTKGALHENMGRHWREALDHELLTQTLAYGTIEHAIGVRAFLENRKPEF